MAVLGRVSSATEVYRAQGSLGGLEGLGFRVWGVGAKGVLGLGVLGVGFGV